MKHIQKLVCLSVLSLASINIASAQNFDNTREKIGPFLGIATGASALAYDDSTLEASDIGDGEHSGTVAKIEAGYWFSDHWGASINYIDLGEFEQQFTQGVFRGTGDSTGLSILGRLPFGERWTLIGKVNLTHSEVKDDGSTIGTVSLDKLTGKETSLSPGIEIDYHINEQAALFMELDTRGAISDETAVGYGGIGLRWNF